MHYNYSFEEYYLKMAELIKPKKMGVDPEVATVSMSGDDDFHSLDILEARKFYVDYKQLDEESIKELNAALSENGIEALAFYKSVRQTDCSPLKGKWGVFIYDFGVSYISELIKDSCGAILNPGEVAYNFLKYHELFHYFTDVDALFVASHQLGPSIVPPIRTHPFQVVF